MVKTTRWEIDPSYIKKITAEDGKIVKRSYEDRTSEKFYISGVDCRELKRQSTIECLSDTSTVYECKISHNTDLICESTKGGRALSGKKITSPFPPTERPAW